VTNLRKDDRGQTVNLLTVILVTVIMVYAGSWLAIKLIPVAKRTLEAANIYLWGEFVGVLGSTWGPVVYISLLAVLGLLFNIVVFTDLIGPDMMDDP